MLEALTALGFSALSVGLGAVIWSVRQEGRINGHDEKFKDVSERLVDMQKLQTARHAELRADIEYVRTRVDLLVNGRY